MPHQILDVQGLETRFRTDEGTVHAINGVSFTIDEGETVGIVGELIGEEFDGDLAPENQISRPVHLAHTALTELLDNLVVP